MKKTQKTLILSSTKENPAAAIDLPLWTSSKRSPNGRQQSLCSLVEITVGLHPALVSFLVLPH